MTFFDNFLLGYWLMSIIVTVLLVGKRREPIGGLGAAIIVAIYLAFITALLFSRGAL